MHAFQSVCTIALAHHRRITHPIKSKIAESSLKSRQNAISLAPGARLAAFVVMVAEMMSQSECESWKDGYSPAAAGEVLRIEDVFEGFSKTGIRIFLLSTNWVVIVASARDSERDQNPVVVSLSLRLPHTSVV
jgi:hypothetical protein